MKMSRKAYGELEAIRKAVAHHVYEEESEWYPKLHRSISESEADMLSMRFDEEFDRHGDVGMGADRGQSSAWRAPPTGGYTTN